MNVDSYDPEEHARMLLECDGECRIDIGGCKRCFIISILGRNADELQCTEKTAKAAALDYIDNYANHGHCQNFWEERG